MFVTKKPSNETVTGHVKKWLRNQRNLEKRSLSLREQLTRYENNLIAKALKQADGNIQQAQAIKNPPPNIQYKLKKKSAE